MVVFKNDDTNIIETSPTKTCNDSETRDTTISILSTLTTSGLQPNLCILDNKESYSLKQGLLKNNINYQLVPPHLPKKKHPNVTFKHSGHILSHVSA